MDRRSSDESKMERIAFCQSCGGEVAWGSAFCPACSRARQPGSASVPVDDHHSASEFRRAAPISMVALGLAVSAALIGATALYVALRRSESEGRAPGAVSQAHGASGAEHRRGRGPQPPLPDGSPDVRVAPATTPMPAPERVDPPLAAPSQADMRPAYLIPPEDPGHELVDISDDGDWGSQFGVLVSARERATLRVVGQALKERSNPIERLSEIGEGLLLPVFRALDARVSTWEMEDSVLSLWEYSEVFQAAEFPWGTRSSPAGAYFGTRFQDWTPSVLGQARYAWVQTMLPMMTDSLAKRKWWRTHASHPPAEVLVRCGAEEPPAAPIPPGMSAPAQPPAPAPPNVSDAGKPSAPAPAPVAPQKPAHLDEDLPSVLKAFDLRLAYLSIGGFENDYAGKGVGFWYSTVGLAVQSRTSVLGRAKAQEASECLRKALEQLGLWRLAACHVRFYAPAHAAVEAANAPSSEWLGKAVARDGNKKAALAMDQPVGWYASSLAYREKYGVWRRADFWADGNTAPQLPDVERRIFPAAVPAEFPIINPDQQLSEPEQCLSGLHVSWGLSHAAKPPFEYATVFCSIRSSAEVLDVAAAEARISALRALLERCLDGLCSLKVVFVRADRVLIGATWSYGEGEPTAPSVPRDPKERTVIYENAGQIDVSKAVNWYMLVVEHRPLRFTVVLSGARWSDGAYLRFARVGAWSQSVWAADENGEVLVDPKDVTLAKPRQVK